jgi:hypothetical protein
MRILEPLVREAPFSWVSSDFPPTKFQTGRKIWEKTRKIVQVLPAQKG